MAYIYDLSDAWTNGATTFTGIKLNVTDTASAAGSLFMDFQVAGVSRTSVAKDGLVYTFGGYRTQNSPNLVGFEVRWGASFPVASMTSLDGTGTVTVDKDGAFRFASGSLQIATPDVFIRRDAANTLAQRNGVNAQAFNLYNTYTDASNYERGFMRWVSNALQIGSDKLGTGTARDLSLQTDGVTRLTIASTGLMTSTQRLLMNVSAPIVLGTPILRIGGATYGTNGFYGVGFGYATGTNNMPVEIGMDETIATGQTAGDFYVATRNVDTNTAPSIRLRVTAAGKLELSDTIKTAAPTGGTSAEWRLGTVASVTATSPNRTIEVDIGGTIYYLHAKTTND